MQIYKYFKLLIDIFLFLCTDLGFYALPAKEELSPMFPHNSSSHEISTETNAFVQNSMVSIYKLQIFRLITFLHHIICLQLK